MKYTRFGNTGMQVSRLTLGCMDFPNTQDFNESARIVDSAIDAGVNFLDTADSYRESEEVLGRILAGKRDKVFLATKVHRWKYTGNQRSHIISALEASLTRLKTDYVDLYQLHHPSRVTPFEETLATLDLMVKQGKIRYIGVSNHYAWQMAVMLGLCALHNWEPIVSIQCRYNILDRAVENETIPFCKYFNIGMMTYSPLEWGMLSGKYRRGDAPEPGSRLDRVGERAKTRFTEDAFNVLDILHELAEKYGVGVNQLAYAWLLSKEQVSTVILGGHKMEHFESVYGVCELEIAPEDLARIDEASAGRRFKPFENQPVNNPAPRALNWR